MEVKLFNSDSSGDIIDANSPNNAEYGITLTPLTVSPVTADELEYFVDTPDT